MPLRNTRFRYTVLISIFCTCPGTDQHLALCSYCMDGRAQCSSFSS